MGGGEQKQGKHSRYVSLGFPRGRCQERIRPAGILWGEMFIRDKGRRSKSSQGEYSDLDAALIPVQGVRQEGVGMKKFTAAQLGESQSS